MTESAPIFDDFFDDKEEVKTDLTGLDRNRAFLLGRELGRAEEHLNFTLHGSPRETLIISARNAETLMKWARDRGALTNISRQINDDLYVIDFKLNR